MKSRRWLACWAALPTCRTSVVEDGWFATERIDGGTHHGGGRPRVANNLTRENRFVQRANGSGSAMPADSDAPTSVSTPRACVNRCRRPSRGGPDGLRGHCIQSESEHDPKRPPPRQIRYLSGFFELDDLGRQLHREALEVGWANADRQIARATEGRAWSHFSSGSFPRPFAFSISFMPRNISWN